MSVDGDRLRVVLFEGRDGAAGAVETLLQERSRTGSGTPLDLHAVDTLSAGIEHLGCETPNVVLLDVDLPDSPDLEGLETILDRLSDVPVLVLTDLERRHLGPDAVRRGAHGHLITDGLTADVLSDALADAVERVGSDRLLETITRFDRERRDVDSSDALADRLVEICRSALGLPLAAVARYTGGEGDFRFEARTSLAASALADRADGTRDGDLWRAFTEGEPTRFERETRDRSVSTLAVPLGGHGVLVTGTDAPGGLGRAREHCVEALGTGARETLDRLDREREVEMQSGRIDSQRERVARVERINALIRDLTTAIVEATTRTEIERAVCKQLVRSEPYGFAWIGEYDRANDLVTPRVGFRERDGTLVDAATTIDGESSERGLARETARTGEPRVRTVLDEPPLKPWQRAALERGYRSVIAVPISYRGTLYSVLTVYAEEPDAFTAQDEAMVVNVSETIAHAINALETKRSLTSDTQIELEFEIDARSAVPVRLTDETGGTFELTAVESRSDATLTLFFTSEDVAPERVVDFAADDDTIESLTHISTYEGRSTFTCHLTDPSFFSTVIDQGALVPMFVADDGRGRVRVRVPKTSDVHAFIEMLQNGYPGTQLVARRERDQPIRTRHGFRAEFEHTLTERQLEVLRIAYFSGYFDWPRKQTGQEIAASLDVSQPTINRHLRISQRKLCELLFDS